jgi:outer membrane immunogenic protein
MWGPSLGAHGATPNFDIDASGIIGGGQAGFNYQTGADRCRRLCGRIRSRSHYQESLLPDVRLLQRRCRFPDHRYWSHCKWLAYAEGGCAGADVQLILFDHGTPRYTPTRATSPGWTVGGGGEYAICKNVSLGVEYDYSDLDQHRWRISCPTCPSGVGGGVSIVDGDIKVQFVTARLNYRFGGKLA